MYFPWTFWIPQYAQISKTWAFMNVWNVYSKRLRKNSKGKTWELLRPIPSLPRVQFFSWATLPDQHKGLAPSLATWNDLWSRRLPGTLRQHMLVSVGKWGHSEPPNPQAPRQVLRASPTPVLPQHTALPGGGDQEQGPSQKTAVSRGILTNTVGQTLCQVWVTELPCATEIPLIPQLKWEL